MRGYFFGNMYLSSIQQGIQAQHVTGKMAAKYWGDGLNQGGMFYKWVSNHDTTILLNAGYAENITDLEMFFAKPGNLYAWAIFRESAEALNCAPTSIGIVLPEVIYEGARERRRVLRLRRDMYERKLFENENTLAINGKEIIYSSWEVELMERLNTFNLAS